jgi:hypothetical protein
MEDGDPVCPTKVSVAELPRERRVKEEKFLPGFPKVSHLAK